MGRGTMRSIFSRTVIGAVCWQWAGSTVAQTEPTPGTEDTGGLQEVFVTAQKRSENLQSTPLAITALTSSTLQNAGITDLIGVAQNVPALSMSEYPAAASTL